MPNIYTFPLFSSGNFQSTDSDHNTINLIPKLKSHRSRRTKHHKADIKNQLEARSLQSAGNENIKITQLENSI